MESVGDKMKFFRETKGIISIFLALIMLPMFTCAGLIIDGARASAAKTAASGAGDLAMNAALSEFDDVLHQVYGLFAMSDSIDDLQENVERYFNNTINNTGILQGSDSYTRSFINSIGSMFSNSEISFDNIVDTKAEHFSLIEVPDSALANPVILERQIVEYMKYRAPVNIGTGLLSKLGCIGETSKQTKVLEAKVDYEKKLDSVQDACETAYRAINAFNDNAQSKGFTGSSSQSYIDRMQSDINAAEDLTAEMVRYIIASKSSSYSVSNITIDQSVKSDLEGVLHNLTGDNKNLSAYETVKSYLASDISFNVDSSGNYTPVNTEFQQFISQKSFGPGNTLQEQTGFVASLKSSLENCRTVYTYLDVLYDRYYKLTSEEQTTYRTEFEKYYSYSGILYSLYSTAAGMQDQWKSTVNDKGRSASSTLYKWYGSIDQLNNMLQDAIDAVNKIKEKMNELDSSRNKWNNRINALSDSDVKTSMKGDYDNTAEKLNEAAVNELLNLLQDNKTHFTALKDKLDSIKLYDIKICVADSESIGYNSRFSSVPSYNVSAWIDLQDRGDQVMRNYTSANVTTGITPAYFTMVTDNNQFYRYLKNICATVEGETGDKKTAKENRTALLNNANNSNLNDINTDNIKTGSYVGEGLTSEISSIIDSYSGEGGGLDGFTQKSIDSSEDGDDKDKADQAKNNLTQVTTMLDGLANVAATVRDKVYLEEYFTEMFSCYTSGMSTEGKSKAPLALNNDSMDDNRFYGSEVEYILWGKDTAEENLRSTKAMIFGVRFALNSIFAFTSSHTRTPALTAATAIAGWTGFGVPIVQTVILLAWGLAESIVDMTELCKGKPVSLYKSKDTWMTGTTGLKEVAVSFTNDVFDKLTGYATDAVDGLAGSVNKYVDDTIDGLSDSIEGSIMTSIQSISLKIIGESDLTLNKPDIELMVDKAISGIGEANADDIIGKATRTAATGLRTMPITVGGQSTTVRQYIIDTIYEQYSQVKNGVTTGISSKIEDMLNGISTPIKSHIKDTVTSLQSEVKKKLTDIISQGGDGVKEKLSSAIDEYMGGISGQGDKGSTSLASGFTMTYKEYLKTFVLIELAGGESTMLKRCAKLIQANVSQKNPGFNITKAYTMVEVNATVSVRTTFFNVPVSKGVDSEGKPVYELDFSRIGSDRLNLDYVGIMSY